MKEIIIFDFDGTLADTLELVIQFGNDYIALTKNYIL